MRRARVFLVDDEQPVLDGLAVTITKRMPELEICGTARSGREAIEAVLRERPDILLMDVRMPGINGLEAIREVRKRAPEVLPILVTAYERFDIAKEAFSIGVVDYLVKPVSQDLLLASLGTALDRLEEREESVRTAFSAVERLGRALPFLEEGFCFAALYGGPGQAQIWAAEAGIAEPSGRIVAFSVASPLGDPLPPDEAAIASIRSFLAYREGCVPGPVLPEGLVAFLSASPDGEAAEFLARALEATRDPGVFCAAGSVRPVDGLRQSWDEAARAARRIAGARDAATPRVAVEASGIAESSARSEPTALPGPGRAIGRTKHVHAAIKAINAGFRNQISLEEIAVSIRANPAYLSRLFAQETGLTFIEYLTCLRIEHAKRALAEGKMSVKEVGADSGYPDPNYFSRIFRKVAGLTPTEYALGAGRKHDE